MSAGTKRLFWAVVLGGLTLLLTLYWRGFPYPLSVLSSLSVAILTYSTVQATERLRQLYRRER